MTQQNRVDPWGRLNALSARGTLMGNRGILHDEEGRIVRQSASAAWLTCLLEFNGRTSPGKFRPGHYSKLFFLDEATALAAGHRPCAECQRSRFKEFRQTWMKANLGPEDVASFTLKDLERQLHHERVLKTAPKGKQTFESAAASLPVGTMIEWMDRPHLVTDGGMLVPWTFEGYEDPVLQPPEVVRVLTPASIVRTFDAGFRPHVHASASGQRLQRSTVVKDTPCSP